MRLTKLLNTVADYIDRCRFFVGLAADDQRRDPVAHEIQVTGIALEDKVRAVVEEFAAPGHIRNILVAIDYSEPAQWAVDEAIRLADVLDARVTLVNVIDSSPIPAPEYAFEDAIRRPALFEACRALLNSTAERIPADHVGDRIVREGRADKQIVETAYEMHADLVVIGTHARGALGRFLMGSVTEAVVRHAGCPVLTIGHPRASTLPEPYAIKAEQAPMAVN